MSEQEKSIHPPLPQEGELTEEALEQTAGGTGLPRRGTPEYWEYLKNKEDSLPNKKGTPQA